VTIKVIYFTRSGRSKRVAEKIAALLSSEIVQVKDNMNWNGIFGFIKAGFYSSTNKKVNIEIVGNLDNVDEFIVVTPLWAGGLAPASKAFLKTIPLNQTHLVVTSDGSSLGDRSGYKSVNDIAKNKNNEDEIINNLVKNILRTDAIKNKVPSN
jgi:flavodoxin